MTPEGNEDSQQSHAQPHYLILLIDFFFQQHVFVINNLASDLCKCFKVPRLPGLYLQ